MTKKILLALCTIVLVSVQLWAIPAKKGTKTIEQNDGTTLTIQLMGDEYAHYWATEDGIPVICNSDGVYEYAVLNDNQQWASTQVRAKMPQQRTAEEKTYLASLQEKQHFQKMPSKRANIAPKRATLPAHSNKNLVILIGFKDLSFTTSQAKQSFSDLLNKSNYSANGATGSVKDYFMTASNSSFAPQFDVYGPYTAAKNMSYYGSNDSYGYDLHPDELVVEACRLADAAGVDFSQYDSDKDGYVDNVSVFYAGHSEAEWAPENTIWPHQYYLSETKTSITLDGKIIDCYVCMNELRDETGSKMCGIGTFTHEFSHALGLPDLYVTDGYSSHNTMGTWDVMDLGPYNNEGNTPPTYSAYERFYMGWLTPTVINSKAHLQLEDLQTSNTAYMISSTGTHNLDGVNPNPTAFYMLENRQSTGWDAYLPGHGMLITKIAYSETKWYQNTVNNTSRSMGVDIMEADGKSSKDGDSGDVFPHGATEYTPYSQYPISNIKESNGVITFDFMANGEEDDNTNQPGDGGEQDTEKEDCFTESFAQLQLNESKDIATELDNHCDHRGWEGTKVFADDQGLKMGSSKVGGSLISPALGLTGEVRVTLLLDKYNSDETNVTLSLEGAGSLSVTSLSTSSSQQSFTITDCSTSTRVMFSTSQGKQRFYLRSFEACPISSSEISSTHSVGYSIIVHPSTILVSHLPVGEVHLYNIMGQLIESKTVENSCQFTASAGVYVLLIKDQQGKHIGTEKVVCP